MPSPISEIILLADVGMPTTATVLGADVPDTRDYGDLSGCNLVSLAFGVDIVSISLRIEYSTDTGQNWATLITEVPAAAVNMTTHSSWRAIPQAAKGRVLFRAMAFGTLLGTFNLIKLEAI